MREDKFAKQQQQSPVVPNPYSAIQDKPFVPDKFNNWMELKKLDSKNYFTKALI